LENGNSGDAIDKKEWDNIGQFLRIVYSVAENDMKAVGAGIEPALETAKSIKPYAQAGDVAVNNQDSAKLLPVLEKIGVLTKDFFDALSDIPDEI
jgi:hypothetical protein